MTQTIEQLTARIAELEAENERLKVDRAKKQKESVTIFDVNCELRAQLAAEQLNNKLLRDALNQWIGIAANCSIESGCCCCGESIENHSHPMTCGHSPVDMADSVVHEAINRTDKALSTPFTPTALPELIEKVEKRTIERCAVITAWSIIDMPTAVEISTVRKYSKAIRALPVGHIKLEDLL